MSDFNVEAFIKEHTESSHMHVALVRELVAKLAQDVPRWIPVDGEHDMPALGQKVLLCLKGVVQKEIYTFDSGDSDYGPINYFWGRDDLDECPEVEDGQFWIPLDDLPPLPASSGPEQTKLCEVAACHCGGQAAKQLVTLADGKEYAASEQCALNHLVAGYAIRPINTPAPAAKEVMPRSD